MLSLNFSLVRRSSIRHVAKKKLLYIFLVFFMDMYDMALFAGYAIYLRTILLTPYDLYDCLLIFASVFAVTQFAKYFGFIAYYNSKTSFKYFSLWAISLTYIFLACFEPYSFLGLYAILIFALFRVIQGFFLGWEMAYALNYANSFGQIEKNRLSWYYFVLMAGEVGILVSIFFNRLLISHGINLVDYEFVWRLQLLLGCLTASLVIYIKKYSNISLTKSKFTILLFRFTWRNEWRYILLRSATILNTALLIVIVIVRVPNILEIAYRWSHKEINTVVLFITIFGAIGANTILLLKKVIKPIHLMLIMYVLNILGNTWLMYNGLYVFHHYYKLWIYSVGFLYGAFLRLTPTFVYSVNDFYHHNRLLGRFMSYLLSYAVFIPIAVVILDYSHYMQHTIHNSIPLTIMILVSLIGIISILFYKPYADKRFKTI